MQKKSNVGGVDLNQKKKEEEISKPQYLQERRWALSSRNRGVDGELWEQDGEEIGKVLGGFKTTECCSPRVFAKFSKT